jgi:hypothetical protein
MDLHTEIYVILSLGRLLLLLLLRAWGVWCVVRQMLILLGLLEGSNTWTEGEFRPHSRDEPPEQVGLARQTCGLIFLSLLEARLFLFVRPTGARCLSLFRPASKHNALTTCRCLPALSLPSPAVTPSVRSQGWRVPATWLEIAQQGPAPPPKRDRCATTQDPFDEFPDDPFISLILILMLSSSGGDSTWMRTRSSTAFCA